MTENSRVAKKRLPSFERVNIRAAHSNAAHSNQGFVRLERSGRLIRGKEDKSAGFFEADGFHTESVDGPRWRELRRERGQSSLMTSNRFVMLMAPPGEIKIVDGL